MIKTLKEYAEEKGFSRQYVYQIQKNLNMLELPLFVIYKGKKIKVGNQKFIEID